MNRTIQSPRLRSGESTPQTQPVAQSQGPEPLSQLGALLGNGVMSAALVGAPQPEGDALLSPTFAAGVSRLAGVPQCDAFQSNQAMMRWMRHDQGEVAPPAPGDLTRLMSVSAGAPLPAPLIQRLCAVLGHDLRGVRVHADGNAARAAEAISARAFTVGRDVFFNTGEYQPGTPAGDALLLHELTHVVQHDEGRLAGARGVSSPNDPAEREAERISHELLPELQAPDTHAQADTTADWDLAAWMEAPQTGEGATIARQEEEEEEGDWLDTLMDILGDTLAGDFAEDPHLIAILLRTLIGVVPVADQVLDAEDICAALYKLLWEGRFDEAQVWLDLVLTVVGCIPEVGSVIKGLGKGILKILAEAAAKGANAVPLESLLKLLGDAAKKLDLEDQLQSLLERLDELSAALDPKKIAAAVQAKIAGILQAVIQRAEEAKAFLGMLSDDVAAVFATIARNARAALESMPKRVEQALDDASRAVGELRRVVREELGWRKAQRSLGGAELARIEGELGSALTRKLCGVMDGSALQALHRKLGPDVLKRLGGELDGAGLRRVGEALSRDSLEVLLVDLKPSAIYRLVQLCPGDALDVLAPALRGKGLETLMKMDFFKFDSAFKSLIDSGLGAAARGLGDLNGRSVSEVQSMLAKAGFVRQKFERGMAFWTHKDGSLARVKITSPAIPDAVGRMESVVLEISKTPGDADNVIAKVSASGSVVPVGTKFAAEQLKQWFKKTVKRAPTADEQKALMDTWGNLSHISLSP